VGKDFLLMPRWYQYFFHSLDSVGYTTKQQTYPDSKWDPSVNMLHFVEPVMVVVFVSRVRLLMVQCNLDTVRLLRCMSSKLNRGLTFSLRCCPRHLPRLVCLFRVGAGS
jgi:hypothetical protein